MLRITRHYRQLYRSALAITPMFSNRLIMRYNFCTRSSTMLESVDVEQSNHEDTLAHLSNDSVEFINHLGETVQKISVYSCINGHLQVAQWLSEIAPEINFKDEYIFLRTCINGHLHVAQWLLQIAPDIDVHVTNDAVFRWSCAVGNLEIAQWLLQIAPDINIRAVDDWAFRYSCLHNHVDVVQWLLQIDPDIIDNADYYYMFSRLHKE